MLLDREIGIGPAEWQMWLDQPTTQLYLQALQDERSRWIEKLAFGVTLNAPAGKELIETAVASGIIQGVTVALEDITIYLQEQWAEAQRKKAEAAEEKEEEE